MRSAGDMARLKRMWDTPEDSRARRGVHLNLDAALWISWIRYWVCNRALTASGLRRAAVEPWGLRDDVADSLDVRT